MKAKPRKDNFQRRGILIGAVVAAAAGAALWLGRNPSDSANAQPDGVVAAVPGPPTPGLAMDGADGELPPGHPPVDEGADPYQADTLPPGHPPIEGADAQIPHADANTAAIAKLEGGLDVAGIFAQAAALAGKTVRVRARVVKSMPNIMGKTWLHIQDGSGDAAQHTNDLVVTTQANPTIGDTVILEGVIATDKDLGSGYRYDVLLEDATLVSGDGG